MRGVIDCLIDSDKIKHQIGHNLDCSTERVRERDQYLDSLLIVQSLLRFRLIPRHFVYIVHLIDFRGGRSTKNNNQTNIKKVVKESKAHF